MPYTIEKAVPADAEALTAISLADEPTPFRRLLDDSPTNEESKANQVKRWSKGIESPTLLVLVAREEGSGDVVSFAEWVLPRDEPKLVEPSDEEKQAQREKRRAQLKPETNAPLVLDFYDKIDALERDGFRGRRRWYLNNICTLPAHRGRGLASRLVSAQLAEADREGVPAALFTDGGGMAVSMYRRLGFVKTAGFEIALGPFGGEGRHVEIAMVREPGGQQ